MSHILHAVVHTTCRNRRMNEYKTSVDSATRPTQCLLQKDVVEHCAVQGWQKKSESCTLVQWLRNRFWELPHASWTYYRTETYCNISRKCTRHQNPRQTCSDLLIMRTLFPVMANSQGRPPNPAGYRATYLVIRTESHVHRGHAQKMSR